MSFVIQGQRRSVEKVKIETCRHAKSSSSKHQNLKTPKYCPVYYGYDGRYMLSAVLNISTDFADKNLQRKIVL